MSIEDIQIKSLITHFYNSYAKLSKAEFMFWLLLYTVIWMFLSFSYLSGNTETAEANSFIDGLIIEFASVLSFVLLTPIFSYFPSRWLIIKSEIAWTAIKLFIAYIPFKLVYTTMMLLIRWLIYIVAYEEGLNDFLTWVDYYIYQFVYVSSVYVAAVFINYTVFYFKTAQKEQINSAQLEIELQKTRIDVLRNQLQPHFLFNTLNLISSTMYQDVDKADSIITRLGDLLRYSLVTEQKPFVTLEEEMSIMNSYLDIAKLRFNERLQTNIQIDDNVKHALIPSMLLQPLLENAVKYGIEPSDKANTISLFAKEEEQHLIITIINPWHRVRVQQESFGVGLENTRRRLKLLYEKEASVSMSYTNDECVELTIRVPFENA